MEAYRTIPLHHLQWPGTVVRTGDDAYCVDVAASFGFSPSSGTYGSVGDAGADLFRSKGIGPLAKWVDDHVFFRIRREFLETYNEQRQFRHSELSAQGQICQGGRLWFGGRVFPDGTLDEHVEDCRFPCLDLSSRSPRSAEDALFSYNFDDIDIISDALSIPWENSKDLPFSSLSSYIGLRWDLELLTVAHTTEKCQKYSKSITEWLLRSVHDLNDVQRLYGKLLHACLVVPAGRSYLTNLEAMLVLCGPNPFTLPSKVCTRTSPGGLLSLLPPFSDSSLPPSNSMTSKPSLMQVQASGLPSPSVIIGEPSALSQDGKPSTESGTLAGRKLLASSCSSNPSHGLGALVDTLRSMVITKEWSRPGGTLEAKQGHQSSLPLNSHIPRTIQPQSLHSLSLCSQ